MLGDASLPREWLVRGDDDLQIARLGLQAGGALGPILVLIQQAVEKYLKGYLISKGWPLEKIHDLVALLDEAAKYDASFTEFAVMADRLTAYYLEARYPPGRILETLREDTSDLLAQAQDLMAKIRAAVG